MPEATDKYSTDYYVYNYVVNPIAKRICFISPNLITFLGLLLTIPICQNLLNKGSTTELMCLALLRYFMDCFDGSVARKCNKKSKFGAIFDIAADTISNLILCLVVLYIIFKKEKTNVLLNTVIILIIIYVIITNIYDLKNEIFNDRSGSLKNNFSHYFDNKITKLIHDNLLILVISGFLSIKLYLN
tara:strand:- start:4620 stop:5180 length:561 start_codon:yes stop_codon:yes gene_type:complete